MTSASFKRDIKRIKEKLGRDFEPQLPAPVAGPVGNGKLYIAGQIFDGEVSGATQVVNVGRPAAARYAPKMGGGTVVVNSGGTGSTGGSSADLTAITGAALLMVGGVDANFTNERYLAVSSALSLTDGGSNAALTVGLATPGTLTVSSTNVATGNHSHAITSSNAPGAAASLLASSAAGNLTLPTFTATTKATIPLVDTASGGLALQGANSAVYLNTSGGVRRGTLTLGNNTFDIDTNPDATADSALRLFRSTSTSGNKSVNVYAGDGSAILIHQIGVNLNTVFNVPGNDLDTVIRGDTDSNLLYAKASTDRIGIGTGSPGYKLDVNGTLRAVTSLTTPLIESTGDLTLSPDGFDVILDTSVNLWTSNYVSGTSGWRLPANGAADILSVTANEMTSRQSIYGAGTAFRVLHHTHDYDHAHVVVNPGGSWNLDEQFGVDIDDNLLVRGYIVGKHAIQLPGAMMICHYDGAEPYESNYTGNAMGHMGQVGVEGGGLTYRPGMFGKAVQIAEATTNLVANPSFEERLDAQGWGIWYGTGSASVSQLVSLYGTNSLALTASGANYAWYHDIGVLLANGESMTVSAYFLGSGSATIYIYDLTVLTGRASGTATGSVTDWTRVSCTWTNTTGSSKFLRLGLEVDTAGATLYFDGVQAEKKAYATPYCDGSLGNGHSWAGIGHASFSSRTLATLTYNASTVLSPTAMTIGAWVRRSRTGPGILVHHPAMAIEFL